jgi:hypothetical protein
MRRADRQRWELIAVLVAGAAVSPFVKPLAVGFFVAAVLLYLRWRRTALAERRGRVFDREAKTDETRTRADQ